MAWRWKSPGARQWACFEVGRLRGRVLASAAAVTVVTGLGACSGGQENPQRRSSSDTSSATSPTSRPEPSPDAAPSAAPPKSVGTECFGRAVTTVGTAGSDRLAGGPKRDVFLALGGDDLITNVGDRDRVCAGGGDDRVTTPKGETGLRVDLGAGSDTFRGDAWRIMGGIGDDRLFVRGLSHVEPGAGRDLIAAVPVKDLNSAPCLSYATAARGIVANLDRGWVQGQGRDRVRGVQCLYGTQFADRITGSHRNDLLYLCEDWGSRSDSARNVVDSGGGDDLVHACSGAELVYLGDGRDVFMGGDGEDRVYGGPGPDDIHGLSGSDHLEGGDGNDRVNGTFYCDTASSAGDGMGDTSHNQVYGGNGDDEVTGDLAGDVLDGGPGIDNGYGGRPGREGSDVIISVEQRTSCF